jgi:circadian clock protein KaiC
MVRTISSKSRIERVPTGIFGFDDLMEGGFEKNSINLLVGGSGCGKTIFTIQFLLEGVKRGEKVLYITFEEKKSDIFNNMSEFGIDLADLEAKGLFFVLEYTPQKVRTMLEEGGGTIENIVLTKKVSRLVIDSITSFELLFDKELEKREAILELFGLLRKWQVTSFLTYEGNSAAAQQATSRVIDFESDSIILLYLVRKSNKRFRFLEILKMRGTNHSLDVHEYMIKDNGININKEAYSGDVVV